MIGGIVVYYKAGYPTLLATVKAALDAPELSPDRLLLVDNASDDGCVEAVCAETGAQRITLPANNGYAAAIRSGLDHLPDDLDPILVLTHECVLSSNAVRGLTEAMTDNVGICAPRLSLANGERWSDGGRFGTVVRRPRHELADQFDVRQVDWVDGAAMLCRRAVLNRLPLEYGMYFEDVELGWVARKLGLDVVVTGRALATQDTSGAPAFAIGRGWVAFQRRTRGRGAAAITTLLVLAMAGQRLMTGRPADAVALTRGALCGWRTSSAPSIS